tara:strand:+ start:4916 stop:6067 length:1152 start_codon:yes stop_codon:yes gene_type:complete
MIKKKKVSIIGSTGQIGKQTINIIKNSKNFKASLISCEKDIKTLSGQIKKYKPAAVYIKSEASKMKFKKLKFKHKFQLLDNDYELSNYCSSSSTDILVACSSGTNSIKSVIAALESDKKVCIASKEIFMLYGKQLMKISKKNKNVILPIDSEHSGIFQTLNPIDKKTIKSIYITASGGPFFGLKNSELKKVSIKKALKHPTWKMGNKITIDSATLMNKAIEIIEASIIFDIPSEKIIPIRDKTSQIHSIIEFEDGNFIFCGSTNDMTVPINYALNYPNRKKIITKNNFNLFNKIQLEKIDQDKYKAFNICRLALKKGGSTIAVLNAANNTAVSAFLEKRISFLQILNIVEKVVMDHRPIKSYDLNRISAIYKQTEKLTLNLCI